MWRRVSRLFKCHGRERNDCASALLDSASGIREAFTEGALDFRVGRVDGNGLFDRIERLEREVAALKKVDVAEIEATRRTVT